MNENFRMPDLATVKPGPIADPEPFEVYSEKYKDHVRMTREDGIIMLQFHTNGRPMIWARPIHRTAHMAIRAAASDPENKVMIVTGTGAFWVAYSFEAKSMAKYTKEDSFKNRCTATLEDYWGDAVPLQENFIYDLNIPTIAAINGPGYHMDMALDCDLVIAADDTVMFDVHKHFGFASGDGINMTYKATMGPKRAAYYMMTGAPVTAQQALDWGMVNELLPREKLIERAWELARDIREISRNRPGWLRTMTEICRHDLKERYAKEFVGEFAMEMWAYLVDDEVSHNDDDLVKMWTSGNIELPAWEDNPVEYYEIPPKK